MYTITAQNRNGDTFTLYDPRSPALKVVAPVCKLTVNKAGLLRLSVPPEHPYFAKIQKLDTVLTLALDEAVIFRGRVLNDEYDLYNVREIDAEGELAYLNDSVQPLDVYHDMPVATYFAKLIEIHNAQVDEIRRFTVGQVTVTDTNDSLYRQSNYETTLDAIEDKLIDRLGGYLVVRYGNDGTRYLDYLKEYGNVNSQRISPRTNLIDLLHTIRGEDVATAIIPLGAQIDDAEAVGTVRPRLTIASVNSGRDYIYDAEAVERWGWIKKVVVHDDITVASNLLTSGYADLEAAKYLVGSIEVDAVDLSLTQAETERIKLGDMILFDSPTGAQTQLLVSAINLPVDAPGDTTYTLGTTYKTMTDYQANANTPPAATDGKDGEDATVLRIDSSRGTVFKNAEISTVLTVTIHHGDKIITNRAELTEAFGAAAYLEWSWKRMDDQSFGVISASDSRLSNDGFALTLSPDDIDTKAVFMCKLDV